MGPAIRQASNSSHSILARSISVATLAGFVAGVIAGGLGSRLAMRISAVAAGSEMQGRITEAGNVVGEISFTGTLILLSAAGFFGIYGGLLYYVALRSWIPGSVPLKGLGFGLLLLLLTGYVVIDGRNFDFHRFGPAPLNIAMFALILIFFGLLLVALAERLDLWLSILSFRWIRVPANTMVPFVGLSSYVFWAIAGIAGVIYLPHALREFFTHPAEPFPAHPVLFLYTLGMVAVGYALIVRPVLVGGQGVWIRRGWTAVGYAVMAIPGLTGLTYLAQEIAGILERAP